MRHDKKIFRESDAILSETDVRHMVNDMLGWVDLHEINVEIETKLQHFCHFFSFEGNQYISNGLHTECKKFIDAIDKLGVFVENQFYPAESGGGKAELWISGPSRSKDQWDKQTWQEYYKLVPKLEELTNRTFEAYKSYRAMVRSTLFI
jgi:hypothetical protein